jgi:hypothetical protein
MLLCSFSASTQLTITSGAHLKTEGNIRLIFSNTNLINNGDCINPSGRFVFTGNATNSISGNRSVQIKELEIAKSGGAFLNLQQNIEVNGKVIFTSSNINLTEYILDLGNSGMLESESETSRITTSGIGQVWSTTELNAPISANPGNLGAFITSTQNLGTVTIKRGHQSQEPGNGITSSVLRYYDISPANNTNLNATLRFSYLEPELNTLPENSIVLWRSTTNSQWSNEMFTARDLAANWVEKNNIASFSRWTLSTANTALPVRLADWNGSIINCTARLTWNTISEQSSSHFEIEHSRDGVLFKKAGEVTAKGNSATLQKYGFTVGIEQGTHWFRLRMVNRDGSFKTSPIILLRNNCGNTEYVIYPNPVKNTLWIKGLKSDQRVVLSNENGQVVKMWQYTSSTQGFDIAPLAKGMYNIQIFQGAVPVWNGSLIKQ